MRRDSGEGKSSRESFLAGKQRRRAVNGGSERGAPEKQE